MKNMTTLLGTSCLLLASTAATAAQVIATDLIVQGSTCSGFDCATSESFGFDTLRLKENNLRINFDDTSASASFPANDWRIVINDTTNGGQSFFAIEDSTAGRIPFKVEAGAPANSLYVDSTGNIGAGTSIPVVEVHVTDGDSPTLRLEQNGSSGFTAQTWDIAGNETNFFVRDVTNGSKLPFKIKPGAPSNSLFVSASGQVGLGTDSPQDDLHIVDTSAARLRLTNSSKSSTATEDPDWTINSNGDLRFTAGSDAAEMRLSANGNLTVSGGYFVNATQLSVPDYVFEPTYELKSIEEQADYMFSNKHLPSVKAAPKPDAQLNLVDQQLGILEELEKAHIYISMLHNRIKSLENDNNELVASMESRLQQLEANTKNTN